MKLFGKATHDTPSHPVADARGDANVRERLDELETRSERLYKSLLDVAQRVDEHGKQLREIQDRVDQVVVAVSEGIQHVDRAERRVKATVARARRELAEGGIESPGLEAEWAELREGDGERGEERGMQPMRESVEEDPSAPVTLGDAFPGAWTQGDLASLMDDRG